MKARLLQAYVLQLLGLSQLLSTGCHMLSSQEIEPHVKGRQQGTLGSHCHRSRPCDELAATWTNYSFD